MLHDLPASGRRGVRREGRLTKDITGTRLGHYEVKERLGVGGMAVVYRAIQSSLGREVALKVLSPALADEQFVQRFENEARTLASLDHPNILAIIDFDTIDGVTFLTMPLAKGGSFEEVVVKGPMEPGTAWVRFLRPVADALGHAHRAGIVHRDLKPANVLIHSDGRPLLADFGLARLAAGAPALTQTGITVGTPGYMAPEQVMGKPVDHRADIYAYAAMVFRALTGRLPYSGDTPMEIAIATVKEPIPSATALRRELPDELDQFMQKGLAKDPAARPQSMAELVALLNKVPQRRVESSGPPPRPVPAAPATLPGAPPPPAAGWSPPSGGETPATPLTSGGQTPWVGSAVSTLQLQGVPRLEAKEALLSDAFFANTLVAAVEVAGPRWPEVARLAGLPEGPFDPARASGRQTPVELPSRLDEAFETAFGGDSAERLRNLGRQATDNWLKAGGAAGISAGVRLPLGRQRKLEQLLKNHQKAQNQVRGETLIAWKQIDDNQFWLVQYANLFALGRRKASSACHFWTASLESLLRAAGLANDWLVSEIECGCVTGSFDCVFAFRSARR